MKIINVFRISSHIKAWRWNSLHAGWDVFTLKYTVEEPVATVLDNQALKSYLQLFKLAWALKRSEHSLNACWVDLNAVQRQVSAFPSYVKQTGAEAYSEPSHLTDSTITSYTYNKKFIDSIKQNLTCMTISLKTMYRNIIKWIAIQANT